MKHRSEISMRKSINRRAFLRGAGGAIAVGLPFLEGLPGRSAWAAGDAPVFSMFMVAANGVVGSRFYPAVGALTAAALAGKTTEPLAPFAANILMLKNVKYPGTSGSCNHAQGLCQALTGIVPKGSGTGTQGGGISVDRVIAAAVNPSGVDSWNLYSGKKSYIAERISFKAAGNAAAAELNPYVKFQTLMGVTAGGTTTPAPTPSATTPAPAASAPMTVVDEYWVRRKSVVDVLAEELKSLQARSGLSMADQGRLKDYVAALRQTEVDMMAMGNSMVVETDPVVTTPVSPGVIAACSSGGIDQMALNAMKNLQFTQAGNMIEDVVKMHFAVTALAFSCNATRVAALQWGDGTDATKYAGIGGPGWPFHQISHRVQSDATSGTNAEAEAAHAKVDEIRMTTLAYGIKQFQDRGLLDQSVIYWTNHVADGPSHSLSNIPVIIAGSGGGKLKQGQYMDAACDNSKVLSAVIQAAGASPSGFGASKGATLDSMLV